MVARRVRSGSATRTFLGRTRRHDSHVSWVALQVADEQIDVQLLGGEGSSETRPWILHDRDGLADGQRMAYAVVVALIRARCSAEKLGPSDQNTAKDVW